MQGIPLEITKANDIASRPTIRRSHQTHTSPAGRQRQQPPPQLKGLARHISLADMPTAHPAPTCRPHHRGPRKPTPRTSNRHIFLGRLPGVLEINIPRPPPWHPPSRRTTSPLEIQSCHRATTTPPCATRPVPPHTTPNYKMSMPQPPSNYVLSTVAERHGRTFQIQT